MKLKTIQRITLYLFFFSVNYEVWGIVGLSISFSRIAGLIYLASVLPNFQQFFRVGRQLPLLIPLWMFFLLLTIVNFNNSYFESFAFIDFTIFQNIILFWILLNHERIDSGILVKGMMAFAIGSISLALLFYFGIGYEYIQGRVILFGDNPNSVGVRMCISFFVIATYIINVKRQEGAFRYLLIVFLIPILMLLAETGSRLAFIAFAINFIFVVLLNKTGKLSTRVLLLIVGSSIGYFMWLFFMGNDVLQLRLINSFNNRDLGGREDIWPTLIKLIKNNPIFGVGTTGYDAYTKQAFGYFMPAHNVILEVLAITGIVGLYLYLSVFYKGIRLAYKSYKFQNDLLPTLLIIPYTGMLLSSHLLVVKIGWVMLAFMASKVFLLRQLDNELDNKF